MSVEECLAGLLVEYGIPGATVGVLRGAEIDLVAHGVADVSTGVSVGADTIFQCGSMTKTWTALAFMQFVDSGAVGLDLPVRTYLPDFRVADALVGATVTPRHLLNHTNGIEEDFGDPGDFPDVYERMVANIVDAPQVSPLGDTHGYSAALGYAILARIMEVVDGKPWDDIMRDRLFEPLGLVDTTTWYEQVDHGRAATGHILRSLAEGPILSPVTYLPRSFGPGGNINSTAREVLTMASLFLNHGRAPDGTSIVSPESIREMTQSRIPMPDPYSFGPAWALGLIVCDWHGEAVYASDGSTVGQHSRLRILPDSGTAVTVLANGGPRDGFYRRLFDEVLGTATVPGLPVPDPTLRLEPDRYVGTYGRPGVRYSVAARDGRLYLTFFRDPMHAQFLGKPLTSEYELLPVSRTHFLMPSDDPLEDTQTLALYDFHDGVARYLHTNSRLHPRIDES